MSTHTSLPSMDATAQERLIAAAPDMFEALMASRTIIQQHNLLSTAPLSDLMQTISRLLVWSNGIRLRALGKATGNDSWQRNDRITQEIEQRLAICNVLRDVHGQRPEDRAKESHAVQLYMALQAPMYIKGRYVGTLYDPEFNIAIVTMAVPLLHSGPVLTTFYITPAWCDSDRGTVTWDGKYRIRGTTMA